jgi:surface carbohydrate biosynthesis protein
LDSDLQAKFIDKKTLIAEMKSKQSALLIPVENQVRELDAKLLLACIAAKRGLPSIIGPKREMEFRIAAFPRSIFLSKSLRIGNRKFFPISRQLGHEIVAWDEEALVHLPAEIYFSRRLSPKGMKYVSHLFAWGNDNAQLWRQYPDLPAETPIHVTGNPRNDLLRSEIRPYYAKEVKDINNAYGNIILINTNFNHVNAFHPGQNLFKPTENPGQIAEFGQAARGMPRAYAEGFRDHKQAIFEDFQQLIPALDKSFPDYTIVVRPHPTENQDVYREIAKGCQQVRITNEGNVVPWLMAASALIHNGCTTGVEAYMVRIPAISYRATLNDYYDDGFYRLPNRLSHQCFNYEELEGTLRMIISGELGAANDDDRIALSSHHLAALDGPLACERIVDVLEKAIDELKMSPPLPVGDRLNGWFKTTKRRIRQRYKSHLPGSLKSKKFERHRYPPIDTKQIRARLKRFQQILGYQSELRVESIYGRLFRISS